MTQQQKVDAKDAVHNLFWNAKYVGKVLVFQAALVLMILGVFYISNWSIKITPNVTIVSPIVEGAK